MLPIYPTLCVLAWTFELNSPFTYMDTRLFVSYSNLKHIISLSWKGASSWFSTLSVTEDGTTLQ